MDLMEAMKKAATDRINNDGVVMVEFDISSTEARKLLKKDAYVDANCRIEDVLDKSVHDYTLTYGLYR